VLRLTIEPSGEVSRIDRLLDRLARADGNSAGVLVGRVIEAIRGLRFGEAPAATEATVPLIFGGNLPWMRPKS
jgi:hypothetical protein